MKRRWTALLLGALAFGASPLPAQFVLFPVADPASEPRGVCLGPEGNVWFTVANQVGRMTEAGTLAKFDLPTSNAGPSDIASGPDGNLWFLEANAKNVGRVSPAGAIAEFPIPAGNAGPQSIAVGPDGMIWLTDSSRHSLWRLSLAGSFTEFPVSVFALGLTAGSDGNLWFTEFGTPGRIGRMTVAGVSTLFSRPTPRTGTGWRCALGPDGNVWYTVVGPAFGRITPSGTITEFALAGDRGHITTAAAVGPDGNLWMPVDESFQCIPPCVLPPERDGVLRITPQGVQTRYELASSGFGISDGAKIAAGPGGSMWLTAREGLVRFFPSLLAAQDVPALGTAGRVFFFSLLALLGSLALRRITGV